MGRFLDFGELLECWARGLQCLSLMGQYARILDKSVGVPNGKEETEEQKLPENSSELTKEVEDRKASSEEKEGRIVWVPVVISAALLVFIINSQQSGQVKLGEYFTLNELTKTNTGLTNVPDPQSVANLQYLVETVLDPLRSAIGPVIITSGYRSAAVNAHPSVQGSASSQHMKGQAVDFVPVSSSIDEALAQLRELPVDQVIIYHDSTHIHVSAKPGGRGEFLYSGPTGYEVLHA